MIISKKHALTLTTLSLAIATVAWTFTSASTQPCNNCGAQGNIEITAIDSQALTVDKARQASFDLESGALQLPVVQAGTEFYSATLTAQAAADSVHGVEFVLADAQQVQPTSSTIATLNIPEGELTIPEVYVLQSGAVDSIQAVNLTLQGDASPPLFTVKTVSQTGQSVFRYETFGDEVFWTDTLRMHEVIAAAVSPLTALSVGLKVDADALPEGILDQVDLDDPATTVALLELDAVVGLKGEVENGVLTRVGVTCALCHSDVDDSVMSGIGSRLDGFANRDLNTGVILSLSPAFADEASQEILHSWGPGRHDPRFNQDGINHPVLIPPIYGLAGVPLETYTGDGPISYWNAYVGVTQMGGQGNFFDPRIGVAVTLDDAPDQVAPHLPALYDYQVSISAPQPPQGSFDVAAASRGQALFNGQAACSSCHAGDTFTDAGSRLHKPEETGMEPLAAQRSATGMYRTTPLRALWQHAPYFHDGSAATLADVVNHYNFELSLNLSELHKSDLVEYLKSL